MKEYGEYQPSVYPWLHSIPAHWEEKLLQNICVPKCKKNDRNRVTNVLSLSYGRIIRKQNIYAGLVAKDFSTYQIVQQGDIILRFTDLQNDHKSLRTGLVTETGIITSAYTCITPRINSAYLHFLLHSYDLQKVFYGMGAGVRQSIGFKDVRHMFVPVPPRAEQDQIVRFLDWKVSSVNKLVSNYRHHIELLDEMKQRQIDEAVIRGMHKSDLVHNDDISWDIDYPEHWQIQRIRGSFSFRKGLSITKANLEETGIAVISYGQIHSKKNSGVGFNKDLIKYVNESYLITNKSCLVEQGDFIFADTSEDMTGCGNCSYIDKDDTIFAGYHSIIAHPSGSTNNKYLAYLFKSFTWRYQVRKKVNGVKVYSITQKMLKDVFILIPPADEQKEIISYLDEVCAKIDAAIKKLEEMIANLQDLKIRLISDVVTGKIDVRNIEIPEYEFVEEVADGNAEDAGGEEEAGEQEEQRDG